MSRRATGTGSVTKRRDGRWQGRFYIGGEQRYVYGTTRAQAERRMEAAMVVALTSPPERGYYPTTNGKWRVPYRDANGRYRFVIRETRRGAAAAARVVRSGGDPRLVESAKQARRSIPLRIRFRVLQKCNFRCNYCGRPASEYDLVMDHVVPVVAGGTDDEDNLVAACFECNAGKAAQPVILDGGAS